MKKTKDMSLEEWCEYKGIDGGGGMLLQVMKSMEERAEEVKDGEDDGVKQD